jgi:hypothetical protein
MRGVGIYPLILNLSTSIRCWYVINFLIRSFCPNCKDFEFYTWYIRIPNIEFVTKSGNASFRHTAFEIPHKYSKSPFIYIKTVTAFRTSRGSYQRTDIPTHVTKGHKILLNFNPFSQLMKTEMLASLYYVRSVKEDNTGDSGKRTEDVYNNRA